MLKVKQGSCEYQFLKSFGFDKLSCLGKYKQSHKDTKLHVFDLKKNKNSRFNRLPCFAEKQYQQNSNLEKRHRKFEQCSGPQPLK